MTHPRRIKLITLLASACGLAAVILWVTPGAAGLLRDGTPQQRDADTAAAKDSVTEIDSSAGAPARIRERPSSPDKTQRKLRNLLSEQLGLKGPKGLDLDKITEFRDALDRMATDELLAILKELDASDASKTNKTSLAGYIAGALARRDPELALDTFVVRISDFPQAALAQLDIIYKRWAYSDPAAAAKWLDRQASSGALAPITGSGKRVIDPRIFFESQLIRSQAAQNPAAAAARFAAMPESEREKMLSDDWFGVSSPEKVKAVADFLRNHYDDSSTALAKASSARIRQGDLGDAAGFLAVLDPVPDERSALVAEALRTRLTGRDELTTTPEEARTWILQQAPQDANRLTGTMLGQMMEWHEFSEMSHLALQYRKESGSDDVLVAFLKSAPAGSKDEILQLAGQISDPGARAEVTGRFAE
jgi:hypothetical protein